MESQSGQAIVEQATAIRNAETAAVARATTPLWYWIVLGVLVGVLVFAISTGISLMVSGAAFLLLVGGRVLAGALSHTRGIRIGQVFGGAGSWLTAPWFAGLVGLSVAGNLLSTSAGQVWPGVIAAVLVIPLTLAFGYGYDHIRLRSHRLAPR